MSNKKIKSQPALVKIVKNLKRQGKKIAAFSGSFDILHIGHIKSLEEAKKQGDVLIVFLNSDKSVRGYKGPKRPINSQENRAQMLAALESVDYITIFDELNAKKILAKIKPDVLYNGADWGKYGVETKTVYDYGGKIYITKWTNNFSTSNLIKKILEIYSEPAAKAIFVNVSGKINKNNRQVLDKLSKKYEIFVVDEGHYDNLERIILQTSKKSGISLNDSWVIIDREKDVILAKEVNAKVIKIGDKLSKSLKLEPDYYASDFKTALTLIA